MTLGNGLLESRAYNNRLQPTEIKSYTSSNFVRYDFTYGYNDSSSHNNGNLMSWNSTGWDFNFNRTYSYDSLNRLSTLSDSNSGQSCKGLAWGYDAWGNRTDQTVTNGTCNTFHASVDTNNRLLGSPYQYDAAGNMTHDASHSYAYDGENRLISVDGGSTASYVYDALGQRANKTLASTYVDYIRDLGGSVVAEWGPGCGSSCWTTGYVYLGGQLLAEYSNGTTYFAQHDHLGSTRLFTDVNAGGIQAWDYLPYGELLQGAYTTTHLFTGDERDSESNLDHTQFRQYSSSLGRWMHPDPAGLAAVDPSNPQSWNGYAYVLNNPTNLIDPLGLSDCPDLKAECGSIFGDPGGAGGVDILGGFGPGNPGNGCSASDASCGGTSTEQEIARDIAAENAFGFTALNALQASGADFIQSINEDNMRLSRPPGGPADRIIYCSGPGTGFWECSPNAFLASLLMPGWQPFVTDVDEARLRHLARGVVRLAQGPMNVMTVVAAAEAAGIGAVEAGPAAGAVYRLPYVQYNSVQFVTSFVNAYTFGPGRLPADKTSVGGWLGYTAGALAWWSEE